MYGIKSVTMFDISRESGVSKKTVYEHFKDKEELVQEGMQFVLDGHEQHLTNFRQHSANAIEELMKQGEYMVMLGKTINPVMLYELQKYLPNVWKQIETFQEYCLLQAITTNLQRGINEELYRKDLRLDIVARMRQLQLETVFDQHQFPGAKFNMHEVIEQITMNFVLGISTGKGRKIAEEYLQILEN